MNAAREMLLSDARALLGRVIANASGLDLADRAFSAWAFGRNQSAFNIPELIASAVEHRNRGYKEVAALGYLAELSSPACSFRGELRDALGWLSKRPVTLCGEVAGFVSDPIALLGISLGTPHCGDGEVRGEVTAWLGRVLDARATLPELDLWEGCLLAATAHRSQRSSSVALPNTAEVADCRLVLRARNALPQVYPHEANADEAALVTLLLNETSENIAYPRATLRAAAYDVLKGELVASGQLGTTIQRDSEMTAAQPGQAKKVFVSYSWDSDDHQAEVRRFANQLRQYGFDATMDLFEPNPPEGLPLWMLNLIRRSDYVLMIITETYRKRCEDDEAEGKGKGVKWEGGIVIRSIYNAESRHQKFLPVLFGSKHISSIPVILTGNTYYDVSKPQGLEDLIRFMSGQPAYIPSHIGQIPYLPPK